MDNLKQRTNVTIVTCHMTLPLHLQQMKSTRMADSLKKKKIISVSPEYSYD